MKDCEPGDLQKEAVRFGKRTALFQIGLYREMNPTTNAQTRFNFSSYAYRGRLCRILSLRRMLFWPRPDL